MEKQEQKKDFPISRQLTKGKDRALSGKNNHQGAHSKKGYGLAEGKKDGEQVKP